jgi:hypothetical protein
MRADSSPTRATAHGFEALRNSEGFYESHQVDNEVYLEASLVPAAARFQAQSVCILGFWL